MAEMDKQYQRLIDNGTFLMEGTKQNWKNIPPERYPIAYYGLGLDGTFVAVGHLMLGHIEQARSLFRQAAEDYLRSDLTNPDGVASEKRALECALFCGDRAFQVQAARKAPVRQTKRKPLEYPYAMFLKFSILCEESEAAAYASQAAAVNRATMKGKGGYGTLGAACQALADRQADGFTAALTVLLKEHKMKSSHGRSNLPDGLLCFPGAALFLLARSLGLPVQVASPFIPAALIASAEE